MASHTANLRYGVQAKILEFRTTLELDESSMSDESIVSLLRSANWDVASAINTYMDRGASASPIHCATRIWGML